MYNREFDGDFIYVNYNYFNAEYSSDFGPGVYPPTQFTIKGHFSLGIDYGVYDPNPRVQCIAHIVSTIPGHQSFVTLWERELANDQFSTSLDVVYDHTHDGNPTALFEIYLQFEGSYCTQVTSAGEFKLTIIISYEIQIDLLKKSFFFIRKECRLLSGIKVVIYQTCFDM